MPRQMISRLRNAARDDSGATIIEMAVVVPVIMLIGLGVLEFGNFFYNYQLIQNGVRDAARFAASMPYPPSAALPSEVQNLAVTGLPAGGTARVAWWAPSDVSVSYSTIPNAILENGKTAYRYAGPVPVVEVSTSVPYAALGFLDFLNITSLTVQASHQERVIGVR